MKLINQKAPAFDLMDQNKKRHQLSDYQGKYVVLYFYPKDMTPGCTIESKSFRDHNEEFKNRNTIVFGISNDDVDSHQEFCEKESLNFPLLADIDKKMVKDYGVWQEKSMFGKKYWGIQRDTFLINPKGILVKHYQKVNPLLHVKQVIKDIDELISQK